MNPDYYVKRVELNTGDESEYPQGSQSVQSPSSPKPAKDFKKILGKTHKESKEDLKKKAPLKGFSEEKDIPEENLAVKPEKDDEENADGAALSLFDLSKKASHGKEKEFQGGKKEAEEVVKVQSPSDLFKTGATKESKKKFNVDPAVRQDEAPLVAAGAGVEKKEKFTSNYTQEQPDLSYVNPFASNLQPQSVLPTAEPKIERAAPLTPAMRELFEQIVKQMYTVTNDKDKLDTVMTLQYPPLFKDARLIVSSFETARGQFNISFENLSQAAQRILDMAENRRTLISALEHKGYNVQIFTTTTILEQRLNVDETLAQQHKKDDQDGQQSGDQPRKRKRDDDQFA